MSWKGRYYYRSIRRGRRVETEYVGTDLVADLAAALDAERRQERAAALDDRRRLDQEARQSFQEACQRAARIDSIISTALHALGFHRAQRRTWRRRKDDMATVVVKAKDRNDVSQFADLAK